MSSLNHRQSRNMSKQDSLDDFHDSILPDIDKLDLISLRNQYSDNVNHFSLIESLMAAAIISRGCVEKIVKEAAEIIIENEINRNVPLESVQWVEIEIATLVKHEEMEADEEGVEVINQGLNEDQEPPLNKHEHWKSYNISIEHKIIQRQDMATTFRSPLHSEVSRRKSTSTVLVHDAKNIHPNGRDSVKDKRSPFHDIDVVHEDDYGIVDLSVPVPEDPLENGLRLAYERETQLRLIKEEYDNQRKLEMKQYQQQMNRLGNDPSKNKYTFDFQGKMVLQTLPKYEKLPNAYQTAQYAVISESGGKRKTLTEFGPKLTNQKKDKDSKDLGSFAQKEIPRVLPQPSPYELIVPEKGVTFYDGLQKKTGPSLHNESYEIMDKDLVSQSLINPLLGLRLTKKEYNMLIQNSSAAQKSALQLTLPVASDNKNQESINISSVHSAPYNLTNQQRKITQNYSINSSVAHQSLSIIKMNADSAMEELCSQDQSILDQEVKQYKSLHIKKMHIPEPTPTEKFHLDILSSRDWGKNIENLQRSSQHRLPKNKSWNQSLPLIKKNPRDRLAIEAKTNVIKAERLPPPNAGNVVGHQYKGYKLGSIAMD